MTSGLYQTLRVTGCLDALSVLARLAPETSFVGLAVSVPTTYSEPFNVSRALATLDFVSGGRAAWNATSSGTDAEAHNFGKPYAPDADERRAIAEEFIEVSRKLWDSWEDDAVITDRARGLYLDPEKLHHINHFGPHFQIRGPQITYRPPQGHLVLVQVDLGDPGTPLSADLADVLILHHDALDDARRAYVEHQTQAMAARRVLRILQSILPILAETEARRACPGRSVGRCRPTRRTCPSPMPGASSVRPNNSPICSSSGSRHTPLMVSTCCPLRCRTDSRN